MRARVWLTALVLLAGVTGLLGAWWVSAQRALDAEQRLVSQMARRVTLQDERALASRLSERLEETRRLESQRPYFHYQNLYHDPKGASEGLSVVPSPLAAGPSNPLVVAHFQIDAKGTVSLPTLNEELMELSAANAAAQRAIRDRLSKSSLQILQAASPSIARIESEARVADETAARIARLEAELEAARQPPPRIAEAKKAPSPAQSRVEILDPSAFAQNQSSNVVYQQLKQAPRPQVTRPALTPRAEPVEIRMGELGWHSVVVAGKPALVALRAVRTPDGTLVQGVLTPIAEGEVVEGAIVGRDLQEGLAIEGTGWRAQLRPRDVVPSEEGRRFSRTFAVVAFALLLVVAAVIWTLTRLQRLAADRARFAATAAHELRTPLASLRLYSDMIADEEDPAKRERYALEISGQTERLGRVVANVLEVTRLERGTFKVEPREGAIGPVIEECVARLRPQLDAAHCRLDVDVAADLPPVAFDADALHHVVDNLVDNAEKFSRDVPGRDIAVAVVPEEGGVAITVSDRGPGVPADFLREPRPFRRAATAASTAGLGLGLFLVDRIVRAHGGTMRSIPREGGGSTISVLLPAFYKA